MSDRSGENEAIEEVAPEAPLTTEQPAEGGENEPNQEQPEPESPQETVERLLKESPKPEEEAGPETSEGSQEPTENGSVEEKAQPVKKQKQDNSGTIDAPHYLDGEDRQAFNSMDNAGRKVLKKQLDRHNAKFTQVTQEAAETKKESQAYRQHAEMYLNQHPELVERGYTGPKLYQELLAAHMTLTGNDRGAAKAKLESMSKALGFSIQDDRGDSGANEQSNNVDISSHPEFIALQEKLGTLTSDYETRQKTNETAAFNERVEVFKGIQNEVDGSGNVVYPNFHNIDFVKQAKPLAFKLAETMSLPEAWKTAYRALAPSDNFSQTNSAKLPAENNNIRDQAASAAVSVRGKTAPQTGTSSDNIPTDAIKPGMTAAETVAYFVRNGG